MKQVLITGASTGIGYSLTKFLCERGHRVWAGVRKPEVLRHLKEEFPKSLTILKLDVVNEEDIDKAYQEISSTYDINQEFVLVNNAGIAVGGPVEALAFEEWHKLFDVNVFAPVRLTQKFLPLIRKTKGRVLNVGSISGRISTPFLASYNSSKFALRSFTDTLRREMAPLGVKVVLIEPGPVKTEIWSKSIAHSEDLIKNLSTEMQAVYGEGIEALRSGVLKTVQNAVPVEHVTKAMTSAIESEHPGFYYLLGKNAFLYFLMSRFMPARWLDKLLMAGYRFKKS